jgi:hypothetical protein
MRPSVTLRALASAPGLMTRIVLCMMLAMCAGVTVAPMARAASCYRSSCNGVEPQAAGCASGARNLTSFVYGGSNQWLSGALLELRYSPACDAAWVRTTGGSCLGVWRPCSAGMQVSGGDEQGVNPGGRQNWSLMWSFRQYVRGCFFGLDANGNEYRDGCTAWN